jgi:hypothetical protein
MRRMNTMGLWFVAIVVTGAVVVAEASATEPYFRVGTSGTGSELAGTKAASVSIGTSRIYIPEIGIVFLCKSGSGSATIFNGDVGEATKLGLFEKISFSLSSCSVEEGPTCVIEPSTITAKEIKASLGYDGIKTVFIVQPTVKGGSFTTVKIKSRPEGECDIAGKYEIKGGLIGEVPSADLNTLLSSIESSIKKTGSEPSWRQEIETIEETHFEVGKSNESLSYGGHHFAVESQTAISVAGEKLGIFTS